MRAQIGNVVAIDKAAYGQEGPWLTYARMRTLRSPKDYTGPDLDVPSLTYQAWHEARFGLESWTSLEEIPRELWAEYLLWVRQAIGIPVRNGLEAIDIAPAPDKLLAVTVQGAGGGREVLHARKLVLATGQEGMGGWWMPDFVAALPTHLRAHAADDIDFDALRGEDRGRARRRRIGTRQCRSRARAWSRRGASVLPPRDPPARAALSLAHLRRLPAAPVGCRRRLALALHEPHPGPAGRLSPGHLGPLRAHANFRLHTGAPWLGAEPKGAGVELQTRQGPFHADYLICGTGVDMDFSLRPELARFAANIARGATATSLRRKSATSAWRGIPTSAATSN
jgi:hypothetical protein